MLNNIVEAKCDVCGKLEYHRSKSEIISLGWATIEVGPMESCVTKAVCPDCVAKIKKTRPSF